MRTKKGFLRSARSLTQTVGKSCKAHEWKGHHVCGYHYKKHAATIDGTEYRKTNKSSTIKAQHYPKGHKKIPGKCPHKTKVQSYTFDTAENIAAEIPKTISSAPTGKKIKGTPERRWRKLQKIWILWWLLSWGPNKIISKQLEASTDEA